MKKVLMIVVVLLMAATAQAKDKVVYEECISVGMESLKGEFHAYLVPTIHPHPQCDHPDFDCATPHDAEYGYPVETPHYIWYAVQKLKGFCADVAKR